MSDILLPVWLTATFADGCGCHAQLRLSANNAPALTITVLHETISDVLAHDLAGNENLEIEVQDNETLTILARNASSEIIACGVYEVDLGLIERLGAVLQPKLSSNLIVDQCAQKIVESAVDRALRTVTGELVEVAQ